MKKVALVGLIFIFIGLCVDKRETIITYVNNFLSEFHKGDIVEKRNVYYRDYDFTFVKNTNNFRPESFQDIINIYYTIINSGLDTYTFKCGRKYETCLQDIDNLATSQSLLSDINNYVHPFNGFTNIETSYDSMGYITLTIDKTYTESQIASVNKAIDDVYNTLVKPELSLEENIRNVHDYIINNTKYDTMRKAGDSPYSSDTAYGTLYEGYAVCGGYADTMALFLERMNVKNYKISSEIHVWNAVYLNNKWLHLDLTWDDPVSLYGDNFLEHNFFLINTEELFKLEKKEHFFNESSYPEFVLQKNN